MTTFHLEFTSELRSVCSPVGRITVNELPLESASPDNTHDADAIAVIHAIADKLNDLENLVQGQFDRLQRQIIAVAVDVAKAALNDEDLLIQKRVEHYVQIAVDAMQPAPSKTVFVHPKCSMRVKGWLEKSAVNAIEIKEDDSILPGDCRIESGDAGVLATLDSFLDLMCKKLSEERKTVQ